MSWVIAGKANDAVPEVGRVYEIRHSRKGTFTGKVLSVNGDFAEVEVLSGNIQWLSHENQLFRPNPETVNVRDTLSYLIEVDSQQS